MSKKTIVILYESDRYAENALSMYNHLMEMSKENEVLIFNEKIYSPFMGLQTKNRIKICAVRNFPLLSKFYMNLRDKNSDKKINKSKIIKEKYISKYNDKKVKEDSENRVRNIILRHDPDIIICFSKLTQKLAIKEKYRLNDEKLSIVTVIAEFNLRKELVNFGSDFYIVENEGVKKDLIELGVEGDRIYIAPMIISPGTKLIKSSDVDEKEIAFNNGHKLIYMHSGNYGYPDMKKVFNAIVEYTNGYNLIAETSGNLALEIFYKTVAKNKGAESVVICNNVDEFSMLKLCDLVICSPETQIMTKAMSASKPMILTAPYGSLQKKNLEYAVKNGFAVDGSDVNNIINLIKDILTKDNGLLVKNAINYLSQKSNNNYISSIIENSEHLLEEKARSMKEQEEARLLEEKLKKEKIDNMEEEINEKIDKILTSNKKYRKKKGKE